MPEKQGLFPRKQNHVIARAVIIDVPSPESDQDELGVNAARHDSPDSLPQIQTHQPRSSSKDDQMKTSQNPLSMSMPNIEEYRKKHPHHSIDRHEHARTAKEDVRSSPDVDCLRAGMEFSKLMNSDQISPSEALMRQKKVREQHRQLRKAKHRDDDALNNIKGDELFKVRRRPRSSNKMKVLSQAPHTTSNRVSIDTKTSSMTAKVPSQPQRRPPLSTACCCLSVRKGALLVGTVEIVRVSI